MRAGASSRPAGKKTPRPSEGRIEPGRVIPGGHRRDGSRRRRRAGDGGGADPGMPGGSSPQSSSIRRIIRGAVTAKVPGRGQGEANHAHADGSTIRGRARRPASNRKHLRTMRNLLIYMIYVSIEHELSKPKKSEARCGFTWAAARSSTGLSTENVDKPYLFRNAMRLAEHDQVEHEV